MLIAYIVMLVLFFLNLSLSFVLFSRKSHERELEKLNRMVIAFRKDASEIKEEIQREKA